MALSDTPLINEVVSVLSGPVLMGPARYSMEILIGEVSYPALKVVSLNINSDFGESLADAIELEVLFPTGTLHKRIYPNRDNLIAILRRTPVEGYSGGGKDIFEQPLHAVMINNSAELMKGHKNASINEEALNLTAPTTVRFQLTELAAEQMLRMHVGTIVKEQPPGEALRYILTRCSNNLDLDVEHMPLGVDIVPPSNTDPIRQFVIPQPTPLTALRNLFQTKVGIYNTGLGMYYWRRHWYLYPLFDFTRFEGSLNTLTLINVPKDLLSRPEQTFKVYPNLDNPDQVVAIVTGKVEHFDLSDLSQRNEGNGVMYVNPDVLFNDGTTVEGNTAKLHRSDTVSEYKAVERTNGINRMAPGTETITANNYHQASQLARRMGSYLVCIWENSMPDLVYPGMPVKYFYEFENNVYEQTGIVHAVETDIGLTNKGIVSNTYHCNSALTLFVNPPVKWDA